MATSDKTVYDPNKEILRACNHQMLEIVQEIRMLEQKIGPICWPADIPKEDLEAKVSLYIKKVNALAERAMQYGWTPPREE